MPILGIGATAILEGLFVSARCNKSNKFVKAKKQICVYSFPFNALQTLSANPQKSPVEEIEDIEILRFLEMGWRIKMIELSGSSIAVDTLKDLEAVRKRMGH